MKKIQTKDDLETHFQKLDAWLDGDDPGERPIDVLNQRGFRPLPPKKITESKINERLWELIHKLASIGVYIESTDHLSDRELYETLWSDCLREPNFLSPDDVDFGMHFDIIGSFGPEEIELYHRYYADEEDRERWSRDFPKDSLPPKEKPPYDRDRLLPTHEQRIAGSPN